MLNRRQFLGALGASAALAPRLPKAVRGQGLNVLHLYSDEHIVGLMGGHDIVQTPNLDRLATESLNCTQTYVASPVCVPTRQRWLTGLHAWEHGQLGNQHPFDARLPTVVASFRGAD